MSSLDQAVRYSFQVQNTMGRFTVSNSPSQECALTGQVYLNPVDSRTAYVSIGDFVYRACPHPAVETGHIGLNAVARRELRVFTGDHIDVAEFLVPMDRSFTVRAVTVCAEYLKSKDGAPSNLQHMANSFRSHITGFVVTKCQTFVAEFDGEAILFTIKSDVRGLIMTSTEIGLEWVTSLKHF
jgi:vesicle-fusing ATPase